MKYTQHRTGEQSRAGQGRAGQGRAGQSFWLRVLGLPQQVRWTSGTQHGLNVLDDVTKTTQGLFSELNNLVKLALKTGNICETILDNAGDDCNPDT